MAPLPSSAIPDRWRSRGIVLLRAVCEAAATMRAIFALLSVSLIVACNKTKPGVADDAGASSPVVSKDAPVASAEPTPFERAQAASSLTAALAIAKPDMVDDPDKDGRGTFVLDAWASKSMRWSDVAVAKDETSYALVMKDAEEERGKRLCVSATVIQIETEKTDFAGKIYIGLLLNYAGNIYRFHAVGSSGTLVQNNTARFCGVVTGRYDYANSGGGQGHAVKLVGMFDLPENKTAKPTSSMP